VILTAFSAGVVVLGTSSSDTGQRGLGHGVLSATAWLELLWVPIALIVAGTRWRETTVGFRVLLLANAMIAIPLLKDFFR
jgi:hypothetical protein